MLAKELMLFARNEKEEELVEALFAYANMTSISTMFDFVNLIHEELERQVDDPEIRAAEEIRRALRLECAGRA